VKIKVHTVADFCVELFSAMHLSPLRQGAIAAVQVSQRIAPPFLITIQARQRKVEGTSNSSTLNPSTPNSPPRSYHLKLFDLELSSLDGFFLRAVAVRLCAV
jgi:hypothetical protein